MRFYLTNKLFFCTDARSFGLFKTTDMMYAESLNPFSARPVWSHNKEPVLDG